MTPDPSDPPPSTDADPPGARTPAGDFSQRQITPPVHLFGSSATPAEPPADGSLVQVTPPAHLIGDVPVPEPSPAPAAAGPRFRRVKFHRQGGMGWVHLAEDAELLRHVALKEIRPDVDAGPAAVGKFLFEGRVTGWLEHPGIVPVYGLGRQPDGRPYYAMRFVDGRSMKDAVRDFHAAPAGTAPDPAARAFELRSLLTRFVAVCQTVAYAHSRKVIHRDLKPSNIMLGPFGETLVLDWGLARRLGAGDAGTAGAEKVGTPGYWAPEQAAGDTARHTERTDVYGLGAILYEILTGKPPNQAEGEPPADPPSPREAAGWVDRDLDAVVRKALAREPDDRHPSAAALGAEVERWLADQPVAGQRGVVAALEDQLRDRPEDRGLQEQLLRQYLNLGLVLSGMARHGEAADRLEAAADGFRRLTEVFPNKPRYKAEVANCLVALAQELDRLGRKDDARRRMAAARDIYEGLIATHPGAYKTNLAELTMAPGALLEAAAPPADAAAIALPAGDPAVDRPAEADRFELTLDESGPAPADVPADEPSDTSDTRLVHPGDGPAGPSGDEFQLSDDVREEGTLPAAPPRELFAELTAAPEPDRYRGPVPLPAVGGSGFSILREIGAGGTGRVFLARDNDLGRMVAIKEVRPERLQHQETVFRLMREFRVTAQLEHPNVIPVYSLGNTDGRPFLVMRYVRGRTLADAARRYHSRRRQFRRVGPGLVRLLTAVALSADALDFAHARGVVHRDPKPHNIMLGDRGEVFLLDWGLARVLPEPDDAPAGPDAGRVSLPDDPDLTRDGAVLGTPAYMAPEMCRGENDRIDARSDVFILGAALFVVLTGQSPRSGYQSLHNLLRVATTVPVPRPREVNPDVPPELDAICARATAFDPADRYPTAARLAADLRAYLAGRRVSADTRTLLRRAWDRAARPLARLRRRVAGLLARLRPPPAPPPPPPPPPVDPHATVEAAPPEPSDPSAERTR